MNISNITPPQVWTSSARSLTNFGSGALASTAILQTSLAASAQVDLRTSPGIVGQITISVKTGNTPTATMQIRHFDGTNVNILVQTAIATTAVAAFTLTNGNSVGANIVNADPAVAGTYMADSFLYTI